MTDVQRHRQEYHKPRYFPVISSVTIETGDLLYWDSSNSTVKAANQISFSSLASAQQNFVNNYIGMAGDRSRNGDTKDIQVDTAGIAEFSCASATFEIGDLVGVAENSGALANQKVVAVNSPDLAIGRVTKRYSSNTTKVRVELFPAKLSPLFNNSVWAKEYTITSTDDTNGYVEFDTGWGVDINGPVFVQLKNSYNRLYLDLDLIISKVAGGKVRVSDGSTTDLTTTDILSIVIYKNNN